MCEWGHSPSSYSGLLLPVFHRIAASAETVEVDSGLVFDDVYKALAPFNRSVTGARVVRIGVGGFLLGGGE